MPRSRSVTKAPALNMKKRVASPEPTTAPSKRARNANVVTTDKDNQASKKTARSAATLEQPPAKKTPRDGTGSNRSRIAALPINSLPEPPSQHPRPALRLFVWGAGNFGQFGMGPEALDEFSKPKKNAWIEEKISSGLFGDNDAGIESIAAGGLHTLFVDEKGTVWSCGVNDEAALGRITKDVPDPDNEGKFLDIDDLTSYPYPLRSLEGEDFRAVKIAAGDNISAAVSAKGVLRVWGSFRGNEGLLGFSNGQKHQFLPGPILDFKAHAGQDDERISDVAAGTNHLVVLTNYGHIYTWGAGEQSQLGRKVLERRKIHGTTPEKVTLGTRGRKAKVIGAGSYHSFAVDTEGDVWGWGLNTMGQTGTGYDGTNMDVQLPARVVGLSKDDLDGYTVVNICGGEHHTLFLTSDGKVYACGRTDGGQLGLPSDHSAFQDRDYPDFLPTPTLVPFPDSHTDDPVVQISVGTHNNLAITRDGALYAWGQGAQNELGTGEEDSETPAVVVRRVGGSWTAVAAACGGQHSLGLFRQKK